MHNKAWCYQEGLRLTSFQFCFVFSGSIQSVQMHQINTLTVSADTGHLLPLVRSVFSSLRRTDVLMQHLSRLIQVLTNGFRGIVVRNKGKVYCSDLATSQGEEQTCFLWKINQWGCPGGKHTACQLKYQIIYPDQVENNWNVSQCSTTKSDWNIVQWQGGGFFFFFWQNLLCQGGIFLNNSWWIEHATNLFGGKEYFKGKVFFICFIAKIVIRGCLYLYTVYQS